MIVISLAAVFLDVTLRDIQKTAARETNIMVEVLKSLPLNFSSNPRS